MAFSLVQTVTDKDSGISPQTVSDGTSLVTDTTDKTGTVNQWEDEGVSAFENGQVIGLTLVFTYQLS